MRKCNNGKVRQGKFEFGIVSPKNLLVEGLSSLLIRRPYLQLILLLPKTKKNYFLDHWKGGEPLELEHLKGEGTLESTVLVSQFIHNVHNGNADIYDDNYDNHYHDDVI